MVALSLSPTSNPVLSVILGLVVSSTASVIPPGKNLATSASGSAGFDTLGFSTTQSSSGGPEHSEVSSGEGEAAPEEAPSCERLKGMLERDGSMDHLFEKNREWMKEMLARDPDAFKRFAKSQSPKYLYIGCSDSRVPAQDIMGLNMGELFVVRNVANLCVNTDHSLLAALEYAVNVLEVTDIIVCGHYGCGGVRAAMDNKDHGLLEHWLLNIRNVQRLHFDELTAIDDIDERHRRFVELNVQESCINLFANPVVQKKQANDSMPRIHGLVYDVGTGVLKNLDIDFKAEILKYQSVYRLHDLPSSPKAGNDGVASCGKEPVSPPASNTPQMTSSSTPYRASENSRVPN